MTVQLFQLENLEDTEHLLAAFKVLSEPRRFQIMRRLMRAELCVCEIIDELGITQSLTSHHLGVLRRADLIRSRREGQWVYYSVNTQRLRVLTRAFGAAFDPASLPPEAAFGASDACRGVDRDPSSGSCCARHPHRGPATRTPDGPE